MACDLRARFRTYFLRQDPAASLFQEWKLYQDQKLEYSHGDSWNRMLAQGIQLLERFCQDDRVRIRQPRRNLQIKLVRKLSQGNEFVAYIDAMGKLDGQGCLLEWKTTSSRYPEEPDGLLALDPQLICYSWITGVSEVAQVVFVRKRLVEIQYLCTTITDEQRCEFGQLVNETIRQIESAKFLPHSGIRFPAREPAGSMNQTTPKQPPIRLQKENYQELRKQVLRRDAWRCQLCGSMTNLEVHHKLFRSHSGDDSEHNLITLCLDCHDSTHGLLIEKVCKRPN